MRRVACFCVLLRALVAQLVVQPPLGGLAVGAAGSILSSMALLHMPPGDLRLSQSQQLTVQGLEFGWPQVTRERGGA